MTAVNRKIIIIVLIGIFTAAILHIVSRQYWLARAKQECLPYKLWLIRKNPSASTFHVKKGDYVYFHGGGIPLFGENIHVVKQIAGTVGDVVAAESVSGTVHEDVTIENRKYRLQVRGDVTLTEINGTKHRFRTFMRNRDGRDIPFVYMTDSELSIPDGYVYVIGQHAASYDSRYWGLLDEKNIIGVAYPLF